MLLRGIYTFDPRPEDHNETLPFTCNDNLIFLEVLKRDSNWIKVADILGRIGYVPKDFVEPDENCTNRDVIITFLVDAVVKATQKGLSSARYLESLRDEIRKYPSVVDKCSMEVQKIFSKAEVDLRKSKSRSTARRSASDQHLNKASNERSLFQKQPKRIGSDYDASTCYSSQMPTKNYDHPRCEHCGNRDHCPHVSCTYDDGTGDEGDDDRLRRVSLPKQERKKEEKKMQVKSPSVQEFSVQLVNVVQETTGLSPRKSEKVMRKVLQHIKDSNTNMPVEFLLEELTQPSLLSPGSKGEPSRELKKIMQVLSQSSKEAIRERKPSSGPTTQPEFCDKLDKLRKLLITSDPFQAALLLEDGQHKFSQDLVHLYRLESPASIKERMLDIFLIISTLDKTSRAPLLSTTLPISLARELMSASRDGKLFSQMIDLLTTLLTCGEPMPDTHYEILGTGFLNFLLKEIEDTFDSTCELDPNQLSDKFSALVNLVLAYNLQFRPSKENIVLKVLAERRRPKGFLLALLQLFQKGLDPLRTDEEFQSAPNPVFKMMLDFCLCQRTQAHLSSSDVETLFDIIVNGLIDNRAGNLRLSYLQVLGAILGNQACYNLSNVRAALLNIFLDSDPLAFSEQQMIRTISRDVPALFLRTISRVKTNVEDDDEPSYLSS